MRVDVLKAIKADAPAQAVSLRTRTDREARKAAADEVREMRSKGLVRAYMGAVALPKQPKGLIA